MGKLVKNGVTYTSGYDDTGIREDISTKYDKSKLLDNGISSVTWSTVRSEITVTTVEDIYKQYRPSGTNTRYWAEFDGCPYFKNRQLYRVTFNNVVYDNLVCDYSILVDDGTGSTIGSDTTIGGCWQILGNKNLYDSRYESTGEPFCILYVEHGGMHTKGSYYYSSTVGKGILLTSSASTNKLKIERANITQTDLPKSLFNNFGYGDRLYQNIGSSTYPRTSLGQGNIVGRGSFAIGNCNISTGQFALAEGSENKATGGISHAEGRGNTASGEYSHAEGANTTASDLASHAEGGTTTASGQASHAEGFQTTASGVQSHAEGCSTTASGWRSHAEGAWTTASNYNAHAEGLGTTASGSNSHAEGRGTVAASLDQHAQGKFNVNDSEGKYAHIVGNGTAKSSLSNAHTLDWSGNAEYQGDVIAYGCGAKNTDGTDATPISLSDVKDEVATKLTQPSSGIEVGKYFKVASLDADGHAVLEACDLPVATDSSAGIMMPSSNGFFMSNKTLNIYSAENSNITQRLTKRPITPSNLVTAVDSVLCSTTASEALTADQQKNACARLGAKYDGEWVLKGTISGNADDRGNIDSGVTVDLSGCTELYIKGSHEITYDTFLKSNVENMLYIQQTNKSFIARFENGCLGIDCLLYKESRNATADVFGSNGVGYCSTKNKKISNIANISFESALRVTSCNIEIYAR